ncbi:MAG: protein kinase [Lentisphaeria bacterium]|nr:protein kinase [Lentisphaeria bacterium]
MERVFHGLRLLELCGSGAYGTVWFCEDISGKHMAVKIISKRKLGAHWERELKGVINYRKITENAPGLLQIFHVEEDDENFFYTMEAADSVSPYEYIPDTLARRLQNGPLPQNELENVLTEVFDGIRQIHKAGFTHRDIKPDNILFVKGVPKIADIGLLSSLSVTMTQLAGTWEFIPPEERAFEASDSTDRTSRQQNDLYAFGKVIYCAVTGKNPEEFPAVPQDLPLLGATKYFFRLALAMCRKDPYLRLNNIEKVETEFTRIKRKLQNGEHLSDRIADAKKGVVYWWKWMLRTSWRLFKRSVLLLLIGIIIYWIWIENKPFDLSEVPTREIRSEQLKLSMTIPAEWQFLKKISPIVGVVQMPEWLELFHRNSENQKALADGVEFIICDPQDYRNCVKMFMISNSPSRQELDKILLQKHSLLETEIKGNGQILLNGYVCYFVDFSNSNTGSTCNNYIIKIEDKYVFIGLSCRTEKARELKKQFAAVLKTLKFENNSNPV